MPAETGTVSARQKACCSDANLITSIPSLPPVVHRRPMDLIGSHNDNLQPSTTPRETPSQWATGDFNRDSASSCRFLRAGHAPRLRRGAAATRSCRGASAQPSPGAFIGPFMGFLGLSDVA